MRIVFGFNETFKGKQMKVNDKVKIVREAENFGYLKYKNLSVGDEGVIIEILSDEEFQEHGYLYRAEFKHKITATFMPEELEIITE